MLNNHLISSLRICSFSLGLILLGACSLKKVKPDSASYKNSIHKILRKDTSTFRKCYKSDGFKDSGEKFSGRVNFMFTIEPTGVVGGVDLTSKNMIPPKFKSCLFTVLKNIKFKEFEGDKPFEVKQPLNFYPKKSDYEQK